MNPESGILALRSAIDTGVLSVEEALQRSFAHAHEAQARLKAFTHLPAKLEILHHDASAPLAGIAVAVKDMMDTTDMPTAYGSPIHQGHIPEQDAWVVQRLRSLGGHVLGKSVTTEFAWQYPGGTVNSWNAQHSPGGSSSGSAAAVAAGIVPLALGTQTLGSVIRPAAFCGVVGLKPGYGSIPRLGVCALAGSLDHIGLFARSVDDVAYALSLLTGVHPSDVHGHPPVPFEASEARVPLPSAPRIGMLESRLFGEIDPAQQALMDRVSGRFADAGAEVIAVALPLEFAGAAALAMMIAAVEAAQVHSMRMRKFPQLLSEPMRALIQQGRATDDNRYRQLKARQAALREAFIKWEQTLGIDVLLMPPAIGEAPKGLDYTGDSRLCSPITLLGVPAITLPAGFGPQALPLGIQLVGRYGADLALLRVARWCEEVLAHRLRVAPALT